MKLLITGANGLLGQKLVAYCEAEQAIQCIATSKGPARFEIRSKNIIYEPLDITRGKEIKVLIKKYNPDILINTAALTQVDQCEEEQDLCFEVNVKAVNYLVEHFNNTRGLFIQLSTDFVFNGKDGPYSEEAIPDPLSFYGRCKSKAERIALTNKFPSAVIRTILVYGVTPGMSRSNIILWVKKNLEKGNPIRVVNDQIRTPTLAEDLALGCILVARNKKTGIFNIGGKDTITPYQLALKVADFYGLDKSLITEVNAATFSQKAQRPLVTGLDIKKARKILGYEPHTLEEGIGIMNDQLEKYQLQ